MSRVRAWLDQGPWETPSRASSSGWGARDGAGLQQRRHTLMVSHDNRGAQPEGALVQPDAPEEVPAHSTHAPGGALMLPDAGCPHHQHT